MVFCTLLDWNKSHRYKTYINNFTYPTVGSYILSQLVDISKKSLLEQNHGTFLCVVYWLSFNGNWTILNHYRFWPFHMGIKVTFVSKVLWPFKITLLLSIDSYPLKRIYFLFRLSIRQNICLLYIVIMLEIASFFLIYIFPCSFVENWSPFWIPKFVFINSINLLYIFLLWSNKCLKSKTYVRKDSSTQVAMVLESLPS